MDKQTIIAKAKDEYVEFVAKFGYLLAEEWKPERIIQEISKDSDVLGYSEDGNLPLDCELIDVDYKSLTVTFMRTFDDDVCELSTWVEVWDECEVVGFLRDLEFEPNTGRF